MNYSRPYNESQTTKYFYKLSQYVYLFGLPNYWFKELKLSKIFIQFYDRVKTLCDCGVYFLLFSELCAFKTQKNLSQGQTLDLLLFCVSHTLIWTFRAAAIHHEAQIREIMYRLTVLIKNVHNDAQTEGLMIQKSKFFSWGLNLICFLSIVIYTLQAVMNMFSEGSTFTTVITVYPEIQDTTLLANVARLVYYICWWIFLSRIFAIYMLIITMTVCLSHQFKNLQTYFYGITDVFLRPELGQKEKEIVYEAAFKQGIKLHSETLGCKHQVQSVFAYIFSGQIVFNVSSLIVLMAQTLFMEHTLVNITAVVFPASTVLVSTGFFMWNAGDVTVEAGNIPTAMYLSGWHNCTGESSRRIRKLVAISLAQAQQPVLLKGLGIMELSYQSYVSIVKSSYSVFSVIFS